MSMFIEGLGLYWQGLGWIKNIEPVLISISPSWFHMTESDELFGSNVNKGVWTGF